MGYSILNYVRDVDALQRAARDADAGATR